MNKALLFRRTYGGVAKASPEALSQMLLFRQTEPDSREAGGILLGRHILGCKDIVIDEVTCPAPADHRLRLSFHRSQVYHQQVIDERWRISRGTCQYLGEWHTHPEAFPTPSSVDFSDWHRRLRVDRFTGGALLFIIIGTAEVRVWEGIRYSLAIEALPST